MGRSVLAYQFTAGLLPHLKAKIAGQEGTYEELLTKARFEEAKYRDIVETEGVRSKPPSAGHAVRTVFSHEAYCFALLGFLQA